MAEVTSIGAAQASRDRIAAARARGGAPVYIPSRWRWDDDAPLRRQFSDLDEGGGKFSRAARRDDARLLAKGVRPLGRKVRRA